MFNVPSLGRFAREVAAAIRKFKYEVTENGIYLPAAKLHLGGVFRHGLVDADGGLYDVQLDPNRVVAEGINYMLGAAFGGATPVTAFNIAPYSGNVTPADNWTGANYASNATEFTAYTASNRLPWTTAGASAKSIGNSGAIAAATMTFSPGGPYTIYGAGLLQAQGKSATTGILVAATRFGSARSNMAAGDKLALEYVLSATDEGDAT